MQANPITITNFSATKRKEVGDGRMVAISLQCPRTALSLLCSVNWFVDALDLTLNGWFDINWKLPANAHFTARLSQKYSVHSKKR